MRIEIMPNPNSQGSDEMVFNEIGLPRTLGAIRIEEKGREILCDVAAVAAGGAFGQAQAVKITDSGEGFAYLIYGGEWGIRLRRNSDRHRPWNLTDTTQWGEPYKIYGSEADLVYA